MYENIKNMIKMKNNEIDGETLRYFTNYFYVLVTDNLIPDGVSLNVLIDNALNYSRIVFYDENHPVFEELGSDVKGLRDPETKTIYIRDTLEEPLKEMVVYHELHHAVQTNPITNQVGINQKSNVGRMIMEAQTQYFAERVYCATYDVSYNEREIPSEELRMQSGGIVVSNLHNYEHYDNMLSKLAILFGVSKNYFVSINFLYDGSGLKDLKNKYDVVREKYNWPYDFDSFLYILDYFYVVDLMAYVDNIDKEVLLSGKETDTSYEIHPNKGQALSQSQQWDILKNFDMLMFLSLEKNVSDLKSFSRFIIDNELREYVDNIIRSADSSVYTL